MARNRRPELKGTLGTLIRSTLQQAGTLRDALGEALDRGTREGRARLEEFRSSRGGSGASRRRADAVMELGELVLGLIRDGEIDLGELPEARDLVDYLDEVDASSSRSSESDYDDGAQYLDRGLRTRADDDFDRGARSSPRDAAYPPSRSRFDDRAPPRREPTRPPSRSHDHSHGGHSHPVRGRDEDDRSDGTVSSGRWSPPRSGSGPMRGPSPQAARVWRPPAPPEDDVPHAASRPAPLPRPGIRFDADDDPDADLAEYMHPDDIPPKSDKP